MRDDLGRDNEESVMNILISQARETTVTIVYKHSETHITNKITTSTPDSLEGPCTIDAI